MSFASKVSFGLCCAATLGIIGYVHIKQEYDRIQLHAGVLRDIELQQRRKAENLYTLEKQIELTEKLRDENRANNNA